ncbi:HpcH/HpaI aldolase/citrate lyase family protein [Microbaculum sp. FT89]|uniref:HpcH/HpaI aldolase/citrate lyase family protein n=1 Tax=Microbaculum sp. FT89 TaxID=3447298 RepID=UPI003F5312E0
MRSMLFVPGDSRKKLAKSLDCGADALIVDLEDSVAPAAKADARAVTAEFLAGLPAREARPRIYVRVNALDTGLTDDDLDAVVPHGPDGIMLPKATCGADVMLVDAKITTSEALAGIDDGATRIVAIATETGGSLFEMGSYKGSSARLEGLTWGAEDLSADIGALTNRDADGAYTDLYRLARALCLAASAGAAVMAIDSVFVDFRDDTGLRADCEEGVRDGYVAKMAIHPAQVATINDVFTPSDVAIDEAEAIVRAMAEAGGAGVASLDGRMIDRPHLRRAERLLARARAAGKPVSV